MSEATASLADLERRGRDELAACPDEPALRVWNAKYFGDKGEVAVALKAVGKIPAADRKEYGQEANRVKESLSADYAAALAAAKERVLVAGLSQPPLDVTLPGRPVRRGRLHPATRAMRRDLQHLRRHGLPGVPQPRGRGRRDELRAAQHAAAPPGPGHVGHVPHDDAGRVAANAHVAGSDPRDAASSARSRCG